MEHSFIGNDFVGRIMKLLTKGNEWYKGRIVWAGDYSEKVLGENTLSSMTYDESDKDNEVEIKLFSKIKPKLLLDEEKQKKAIIVNHTKKEYVKFSDCKTDINPLPLLTALGNGGGGGDYHGNDMGLVGRWAFDEISVEFSEQELKDYTKLETNFKEGEEEENSEENEIKAYENIKKWLKTIDVKKRLILGGLK